MTAGSSTPGTGKQQPRPRHVPQRTCVACRAQQAKRELVRIVRTPEGRVLVDLTGRMDGRGAYLHRDASCWTDGLRKGRLSRALHAAISAEDQAHLGEFMNTAQAEPPALDLEPTTNH